MESGGSAVDDRHRDLMVEWEVALGRAAATTESSGVGSTFVIAARLTTGLARRATPLVSISSKSRGDQQQTVQRSAHATVRNATSGSRERVPVYCL
jgi:hypothetical protein